MNIRTLIRLVREIDLEAADYLENEALNLHDYCSNRSNPTINNLFTWSESEQGHTFWSIIDEKVRKKIKNLGN